MAGIESNYMTNLGKSLEKTTKLTTKTTGSSTLDMDDFYKLMAAQLQNQDMTSPMDQSEFMNQLAMMTTVQAVNELTNISVISYAASLVGKDVTVAKYDSDGNMQETFGTVTATGMYGGEQVIFVDDEVYKLSAILSVGKLPEKEEVPDEDGDQDGGETDPVNPDTDPTKPSEGEGTDSEKVTNPDTVTEPDQAAQANAAGSEAANEAAAQA